MAASTILSTPLSLSSSSSTLRQSSALPSSQCMTLPTLSPPPPPVPSLSRPSSRNVAAYCRKIARNVVSMATGDTPAEIGVAETPEIVKTVQEAWDKVEDYAVSSLVVTAVVGLIGIEST